MEFHNVKLLPKGLPEIVAQLIPYDIYSDTKLVVHCRKITGGVQGAAGYDNITESYVIDLYPTVISVHCQGLPGTHSFNQWLQYLKTALHEIGHLATRVLIENIPSTVNSLGFRQCSCRNYIYVEELANKWRDQALARILRVDTRLGQPEGFITGYAGIRTYRWLHWMPTVHHRRLEEFRGFRCGGQITLGTIANTAICQLLGSRVLGLEDESHARLKRIAVDQVRRAADSLGIRRYAFSSSGRRYLMFSVGEAEAVYEWLVDNKNVLIQAYYRMLRPQPRPKYWKWELVDGSWDLVEIDTPQKVPPEQMRLPF